MELARSGEMGEILHLAKSGRLIIRIRQGVAPRAGQLLLDNAGKRIGKIVELIGPVSAPYASVMPLSDRANKLTGLKVYDGGFSERTTRGVRPTHKRGR